MIGSSPRNAAPDEGTCDDASAARRRPGSLRALLVPADQARPVDMIRLDDSAAAFSLALGDVLLDAITAEHAGHRFAIYVPDDVADHPDNPRAGALAARVGLHDRAVQARLRGDALLTGLSPDREDDCDVPQPLVDAARRLWLKTSSGLGPR